MHANECNEMFIIHYHRIVWCLFSYKVPNNTLFNAQTLNKAHCGCEDIT